MVSSAGGETTVTGFVARYKSIIPWSTPTGNKMCSPAKPATTTQRVRQSIRGLNLSRNGMPSTSCIGDSITVKCMRGCHASKYMVLRTNFVVLVKRAVDRANLKWAFQQVSCYSESCDGLLRNNVITCSTVKKWVHVLRIDFRSEEKTSTQYWLTNLFIC